MHDPDDLKEAVQRLSRGETVGMVDAELKRKGLQAGPRSEVLKLAKHIVKRRFRLKRVMFALFGGLVLVAGGCWVYYNIQNGIRIMRIPGLVAVIGLLTVICRLCLWVHKRV